MRLWLLQYCVSHSCVSLMLGGVALLPTLLRTPAA